MTVCNTLRLSMPIFELEKPYHRMSEGVIVLTSDKLGLDGADSMTCQQNAYKERELGNVYSKRKRVRLQERLQYKYLCIG